MAQEEKQKGKMDTEAMMEVYTKLGTPGAPHKVLASMAGSWNTKVKSCMEPGKPPTESAGTSEQKMILGGRFLSQDRGLLAEREDDLAELTIGRRSRYDGRRHRGIGLAEEFQHGALRRSGITTRAAWRAGGRSTDCGAGRHATR